eukprot:TRINITY_DN16133_c1_g1_i2.p1 TRINITY_DN16133_c1_g1~~TRINITY_DN16133_c1_g1_i2.p1  ORF type:complete len:984 (+),score=272.86 TRINITY_DN16133_c1_g1_i2:2-2953(+)
MTVKEEARVGSVKTTNAVDKEEMKGRGKDEVDELREEAKGKRNTIVLGNEVMQPGQLGKIASSEATEGDLEGTVPVGMSLSTNPSTLSSDVIRNMHLSFLHFNDVYHIAQSAKEPVGGAPRFSYKVKEYQHAYSSDLMFSGDCYNPSLMSTVTKGKHMTPILNELNIKVSVYGNHDFDFGLEVLQDLTESSNHPWLMSNVIDTRTNEPAADGLMSYTYVKKNRLTGEDIKIGVIGIGEEEWLSCVKDLPDFIEYRDAVAVARREATKLREAGCHLTIALTHMRHNNDIDFITAVPEIDIVFGGHDHFYKSEVMPSGQLLLKSGTDFKNLSFVAVQLREGQRPVFTVERIDITSDIPEDPVVAEIVSGFEGSLKEKIGKELCHLECHMDITTEAVRTAECGMGNLICDIMREHCEADCAFVNSGILRADVVYHPSPLSIKDLLDIIPIEDVVVCVEATGEQILSALENGLSKWPQHEGRFLQMSNIQIHADPDLPSGSRILQCKINGALMDNCKLYTLATTAFLCKGCDGFEALKGSKYIIDPENGPVLPTLVRKAIEAMVPVGTRMERRESIHSLKQNLTNQGVDNHAIKNATGHIKRAYLPSINPQVDGRIILDGVTQLPPPAAGQVTPMSAPMMSAPMPSGQVSPMVGPFPDPDEVQHGTILRDISMVKRHFKDLALRLPTTTAIEWHIDMLPYLGHTGVILGSFPDVGVTQVKFQDGASFWFPTDSVVFGDEDMKQATMTPPPPQALDALPGHQVPLRPNSSMGYNKITRAKTDLDMRRRFFPVPKERTLSFIFRPVGTDDVVTMEEVNQRSKRDKNDAARKGSKNSTAPSDSVNMPRKDDELVWSLVTGNTLHDYAWENNLEEAEALLASGNEDTINRVDIGAEDSWEVHKHLHAHFGLGGPDAKATALHYAAVRGNADMVKLLIDYHADPSVKSDLGFNVREAVCARKAIGLLHGKQDVVVLMDDMLTLLDTYKPQPR